jgi:hypothetical protein
MEIPNKSKDNIWPSPFVNANNGFPPEKNDPRKKGGASSVPTEPTLQQWFGYVSQNRATYKVFRVKVITFKQQMNLQ